MQKGMGIVLAILGVISVVAVVGIAIWMIGGQKANPQTNSEKKNREPIKKAEGSLQRLSYYRGGGMDGEQYSLSIYSEGGQVKMEVTDRVGYPYAEVRYMYRCPDDSLQRLQKLMEEEGLWTAEEIKDEGLAVVDMPSTSWSFQTDQGQYPLYSGFLFPDEAAKSLYRLRELQTAIYNESELLTDLNREVIAGEDFLGIQIYRNTGGDWLSLEVRPDKENGWTVSYNGKEYPGSQELVDEIYRTLETQREMLTIYPLNLERSDESGLVQINWYIRSKEDETARRKWDLVQKTDGGRKLTEQQQALVTELIRLIEEHAGQSGIK